MFVLVLVNSHTSVFLLPGLVGREVRSFGIGDHPLPGVGPVRTGTPSIPDTACPVPRRHCRSCTEVRPPECQDWEVGCLPTSSCPSRVLRENCLSWVWSGSRVDTGESPSVPQRRDSDTVGSGCPRGSDVSRRVLRPPSRADVVVSWRSLCNCIVCQKRDPEESFRFLSET